jgi:hypothetical protein
MLDFVCRSLHFWKNENSLWLSHDTCPSLNQHGMDAKHHKDMATIEVLELRRNTNAASNWLLNGELSMIFADAKALCYADDDFPLSASTAWRPYKWNHRHPTRSQLQRTIPNPIRTHVHNGNQNAHLTMGRWNKKEQRYDARPSIHNEQLILGHWGRNNNNWYSAYTNSYTSSKPVSQETLINTHHPPHSSQTRQIVQKASQHWYSMIVNTFKANRTTVSFPKC